MTAAVRSKVGQAAEQTEADTKKILTKVLSTWVKPHREEYIAVELVLRSAYPVGASVALRARLLSATCIMRL